MSAVSWFATGASPSTCSTPHTALSTPLDTCLQSSPLLVVTYRSCNEIERWQSQQIGHNNSPKKNNFISKTTSFITNKTPVNNLSNYLYLLVSVFCQEPLFYDRYIAWFRIDDSFTDMLVRETGCTGT